MFVSRYNLIVALSFALRHVELLLRSVWKSLKDFLKAYAFNHNKSIHQAISSGRKKVWRCTSECVCCWQVTLSKKAKSKAKSKRTKTKNSFCPENAWFVSALLLEHSPGSDSIGQCSTKDMMELPGFQSAIVPGLSSALKRVAESVKIVHNIKIAAVTDDTYGKLPAFLRWFERQNPGSRGCCQLDSMGHFYRAFLSLGSLIAGQDNWVPILECDGTHMKHAQYNGVCVLLVGKDGDWANIPVAVAFVHKETADNFEWFFRIVLSLELSCMIVSSSRTEASREKRRYDFGTAESSFI